VRKIQRRIARFAKMRAKVFFLNVFFEKIKKLIAILTTNGIVSRTLRCGCGKDAT
jgi:nickel-dependent lactate racemase